MTPDALTNALLDRSLPFSEWTHAGHLTAAYMLTRRLGPTGALDALRAAIPAYNAAVHGPDANTDRSGYHETITCYYAWAVASVLADGGGLDDVLASPAHPPGGAAGLLAARDALRDDRAARVGAAGPRAAQPAAGRGRVSGATTGRRARRPRRRCRREAPGAAGP